MSHSISQRGNNSLPILFIFLLCLMLNCDPL